MTRRRLVLALAATTALSALAVTAGKDAQQPSRRTARRGSEIIITDVDHPGALADGQAAQGDDVAGIKLALGLDSAQVGIRRGHRERVNAENNRVAGEAV